MLELISGPVGQVDAGIFNLPPDFDQTKFAAEWVEEGQVGMKQQRQVLAQTGMSADGWQVWKNNPKNKQTETRGSGNKTYVLMCRPKEIQRQVNAAYGNVSKRLLNSEIAGETNVAASATPPRPGAPAGGMQLQDQGMISEDAALGRSKTEVAESTLPLNPVDITAGQET